jgi:hypothetical protein
MPTQNVQTIQTPSLTLSLDAQNGALLAFDYAGRSFIAAPDPVQPRALFGLRLRAERGQPIDIDALSAAFSLTREDAPDAVTLTLCYEGLGGLALSAQVTLRCPLNPQTPFTTWRITVDNATGLLLDHIDFPNVVVPATLKGAAAGGDATLFRPNIEGVLIEDMDILRNGMCPPKPVEFPHTGWGYGLYPATCTLPFMAYYDDQGRGLYLGAHDPACGTKGLTLLEREGGLLLGFRIFPGGPRGEYSMSYDIVLGGFHGDWHAAADIYRTWRESDASGLYTGPKLRDNPRVPDWLAESPVVAIYPVRGQKDTGDMSPNEYFPFPRALPVMDKLGDKFGSPILALLAHWESSAPWAPPYAWPPLGGEGLLQEYVTQMHAHGHRVGLYASGLGYTLRSVRDPRYIMQAEFDARGLAQVMTVAPDGTLAENGVCCGEQSQRIGYDMCPANEFVHEVTQQQFGHMLNSGVDYVQYFDQNLGGAAYFCYARNHGHPPAPGPWMTETMIDLYRELQAMVDASGRKVPIGTESAAAEPFVPYLLFNDLRYEVNFGEGTPVPAYAYVFHEYVNNFMGNQNTVETLTAIARTALHMHLRLAYSFVAGDLFTVVLAGADRVNWCWGITWEQPMPDQDSVATLIRNLNAWRTGAGKPYLFYGRMLAPYRIEGAYDVPIYTHKGKAIHFDSLLTSRWQSATGQTAQVIANYTREPQTCKMHIPGAAGHAVRVYSDPRGDAQIVTVGADERLALDIPALSAVLVEFESL